MKLRCIDGKIRNFRVANINQTTGHYYEARCNECGEEFGVADTYKLKPLFIKHICKSSDTLDGGGNEMRGLDKRFLDAMRKGLDKGRLRGRVGWDRHWKNTWFPYSPTQCLIDGLHREIDELIIALSEGDPDKILTEASDTANFCMFLADMAKEEMK